MDIYIILLHAPNHLFKNIIRSKGQIYLVFQGFILFFSNLIILAISLNIIFKESLSFLLKDVYCYFLQKFTLLLKIFLSSTIYMQITVSNSYSSKFFLALLPIWFPFCLSLESIYLFNKQEYLCFMMSYNI